MQEAKAKAASAETAANRHRTDAERPRKDAALVCENNSSDDHAKGEQIQAPVSQNADPIEEFIPIEGVIPRRSAA